MIFNVWYVVVTVVVYWGGLNIVSTEAQYCIDVFNGVNTSPVSQETGATSCETEVRGSIL